MGSRHHGALCAGLTELHKEERYADFRIIPAEGKPGIPCHKVVMAAMSPFFDTMLNNPMKESEEGSVELPFDRETIGLLLNYIYSGQDVVTKETVTDLYHAAHFLQIPTLVDDCKTLLNAGINESESLEVWIISKRFGDKEVAEIARSIVLQGFNMLCTLDHMSIVPFEDLKDLFEDQYLNCSGTLKCKAAWLWLAAQDDPDVATAEKLIKALVGAGYVDNSDILEVWDEQIQDIPDDRMGKLLDVWQKACKKLWISVETPAARSASVCEYDECIVIVGSDKKGINILIAFDFKKKKWYNLNPMERDLGHRYAVCSRDNLLYVSGGTPSPKSLLCFEGYSKQWSQLQNMPVGREQHVMCRMDKRLYILGGSSNTTEKLWDVNVYDCVADSWKTCGQVALPVVAACSVTIDDNIILLGGSDQANGRAPADILQYYNTTTNTSAYLPLRLPFKTKSQAMSTVSISNSIYIIHKSVVYKLVPFARKVRAGEQKKGIPGIQKVDPSIAEIGKLDVENPPIKGFAATSFGNKILLLGGEDGNFTTKKSMIQYDVEMGHAVLLPLCMPEPMKDFCLAELLVPRSWGVEEMELK